ncbi:MAG: D-alanine--D-alanine ligase [Spirochaetia bacterium]|nr:D-alanine--D-alanine ligase [Spirochaetia bacterium]MCF7940994.1 D-alanine--D-alanine ligase [Spirochaetia bacterium]
MMILLMYGGRSVEHEVSCSSAATVYEQLLHCGYELTCIAVAHDGRWYHQKHPVIQDSALLIDTDPEAIVSVHPQEGLSCGRKSLTCDVILPLLHGSYGEDGTLQGLLELIDLPYIGSDQTASSVAMKKSFAKAILAYHHIPLTPFHLVDLHDRSPGTDRELAQFIAACGYPLFIKPDSGGSSVGVSRVDDARTLEAAFSLVANYHHHALIEPCIEGIEIECGVFAAGGTIHTSLPGSLTPSCEFYSYEAKYGHTQLEVSIPADIPDEDLQQIRRLSKRIYRLLGCDGFARVDFFYDRRRRTILFNEINTIPGMTDKSLFMRLFLSSSISWARLFELLIEQALERHRLKGAQVYRIGTAEEVY